jgi:hypothetical protein
MRNYDAALCDDVTSLKRDTSPRRVTDVAVAVKQSDMRPPNASPISTTENVAAFVSSLPDAQANVLRSAEK